MRQSSTGTHPIRATIAALAGSVLTAVLGATGGGMVAEVSAWASPDRLVAVATVCLGAGAAAVLTTGCWLLAASGFAPGFSRPALWCGRLGARLTPALLRRAVGLTVGAGIGVTVLGGIAVASETDLGWEVTTGTSQRGDAEDSAIETSDEADDPAAPDEPTPEEPTRDEPAPDEPAQGASTAEPSTAESSTPIPPETPGTDPRGTALGGRALGGTAAAAPEAPPAAAGVTVRPGDSLWRIAAHHLGSGASDAEIAATWPLWYQANQTVIGSDPGLIHPGQVLAPPDASVRAQ